MFIQKFIQLLVAALLAVTSAGAFAQNTHYKKGSPDCVDNGTTATCTGSITGLGNGDVKIDLVFPNATATTLCHNPGSKDYAVPGQNPATPVEIRGTLLIPGSAIKNGNASFTVTTLTPTAPTPQQAGCPSSNWTVTIADVIFGRGTLTISQTSDGGVTFQTVITTTIPSLPFLN